MSTDADTQGREKVRRTLWDGFLDADFRAIYFAEYTDRLRRQIRLISFGIGMLSCGPLVAALSANGAMWLLSWLGVGSAVLGIYMTSAGLPRRLATSTAAAQTWNAVARERKEMWYRFESGQDVDIEQLWLQDRDLNRINDAVLQDLPEDEALARRAVEKSEQSLGLAA